MLYAEVVAPLKNLSNFWTFLYFPLINCGIEFDLSLSRNCIISEISRTAAAAAIATETPKEVTETNSATFHVFSAKLYVSVVTLSINDNINLLENLKQRFKITISGNNFRSDESTQPKNDNLDYIIDTTIININRLFVLSFTNGNKIT